MENLISLIIDLLGALFGDSKKQTPANPSRPDRPDPSRPRVQARPTAWEDELRRLLEGQAPPPAKPPPPVRMATQPPVVISARMPPVSAAPPADYAAERV